MTLQKRIKHVPGLQYLIDNMELMSSAGRRRMMEQPFLTSATALAWEQQVVSSIKERMEEDSCNQSMTHLRHQLMQLHDLKSTLRNLHSHTILDEVELFEIKNLAHICGHARTAISELGLEPLLPMPDLSEVFKLLDPDSTGIPNFYIYDSYHPSLGPIRKKMKSADDSLMAELLAQQNELQQIVISELCDRLFPFSESLINAMEQMAYTDYSLARATLAIRWDLQVPSPSSVSIGHAALINPRLKKHNEEVGLRYQPIDINITHGVTLITGANMAGKTVLLKSVGLAQLMYQYGYPVPSTHPVMMPVDDVVFCIGDEQNEMNGLSSFASEITRISDVIKRSQDEHLLVLIDEPARTTNPIEGKALVQSIATIMESRKSITMITTHYSQLGVNCNRLRVRGFVASMVDTALTAHNINRFIDYSLVPDTSDEVPQEALHIAEMLDCDAELIHQAREKLKDNN